MAKYKSTIITNSGLALEAATHSGDTIVFTAIKTGAGIYDGTEILSEATGLKDTRQTLGISGLTVKETVIKIRSVLSNNNLTDGYGITEIGLYARDSEGNEILYAIILAEPGKADYLPAYADAPTSITFELYIDITSYESGVVFNAAVVEGVYTTVEDFNDYKKQNDETVSEMQIALSSINTTVNNLDSIRTQSDIDGTIDTKSILTNTNVKVATLTLTEGKWLVWASVRYPANGNGYRYLGILDYYGLSYPLYAYWQANVATNVGYRYAHSAYTFNIFNVEQGSTLPVYLLCYQDSGSPMTLEAVQFHATRIS